MCTLTERDQESSRLRASVSKQVSALGPLSSRSLRSRARTIKKLVHILRIISDDIVSRVQLLVLHDKAMETRPLVVPISNT